MAVSGDAVGDGRQHTQPARDRGRRYQGGSDSPTKGVPVIQGATGPDASLADSHENKPKLQYRSKGGKPSASGGDSSNQQEVGGEVGTSTSEDGVGRNPVEWIRSYFLSRVASSLERGAKPSQGIDRADPITRMTDLIGRSWDAVSLKRAGEKARVSEDVRIITGGTNIKSEVLPLRLALLL